MFKSKGFTTAFILMSLVAALLLVFFLSLVFGKGKENLVNRMASGGSGNNPAAFAQSSEEEEHSTEFRALFASEEHVYPVLSEEIKESGNLTVIEGATANGVVFHKLPQFDGSDAEGNVVHTSGTYRVISKIYIPDGEIAYLMYRVEDGYYVTSNANYVSYEPDNVKVLPDSKKKKVYGSSGEAGVILRILQEDGNHLAFSVFLLDGEELEPVLENLIASYDAFGTAHFEYKCGNDASEGTLVFGIDGGSGAYKVTVNFDGPVTIGTETVKILELK